MKVIYLYVYIQETVTCVRTGIGKHQALSCEVTCNFIFYLKVGRTSVLTDLNNHEQLPLSTIRPSVWNWPNVKVYRYEIH